MSPTDEPQMDDRVFIKMTSPAGTVQYLPCSRLTAGGIVRVAGARNPEYLYELVEGSDHDCAPEDQGLQIPQDFEALREITEPVRISTAETIRTLEDLNDHVTVGTVEFINPTGFSLTVETPGSGWVSEIFATTLKEAVEGLKARGIWR